MKFSKMHIFRYSPRPGTPAARLEKKVREKDVRERSKKLFELSSKMQEEFSRSFLDETLEVLVERRKENDCLAGLTDNYIRAVFDGPENLVNKIVKVKITQVEKGYVVGKLL
ncbi:Threonylcarbamoyladenosine tRNA methylthiotransferase MtaB [subsurface metagenome]